MADIVKQIVGTWRLVNSISISPSGETECPLGSDAIGYICYSDSGLIAVQ